MLEVSGFALQNMFVSLYFRRFPLGITRTILRPIKGAVKRAFIWNYGHVSLTKI